ncbi:MAG TPA: DUF5715 family protein [Gemmatimonadaceae bacterium]|nr:DUF5715 family protein [Gemmatimonadaceae bacterium]
MSTHMNALNRTSFLLSVALLTAPMTLLAGGLRGSPSSMAAQHEAAVEDSLTFIARPAQVELQLQSGELERVEGNADYSLSGVSFPYAVPEVKLFLERLAAQYRAANDEILIVTSLTRPSTLQPRNAHQLSVHPAGMAVDFRVPNEASERAWLERALLGLENAGVLDVTRERFPPHYHVAVFPTAYRKWVERRDANAITREAVAKQKPVVAASIAPMPTVASSNAAVVVHPKSGGASLPLIMLLVPMAFVPAFAYRRRMQTTRTK